MTKYSDMESYYIVWLILSKIVIVTVICETERHPWDIEFEDRLPTPGASSVLWKNKNQLANYTGLLYAPRLSYNWIVYVYVNDKQQADKNVAIGNLISEKLILSNCRVGKLIKKASESYVIYATQYLDEKHLIKTEFGTYDVEGIQGKQPVGKVTLNPHCKPKTVEWDLSILEVSTPIRPLVPLIGLMPIAIDYENRRISPFEFPYQSKPGHERTTCWVASFGRQSYNNEQFLETTYSKVQYRVYHVPLVDCTHNLKLMCKDEPCTDYTFADILRTSGLLRCYDTRSRVGGVCDQDRGAPIVCDGEVIGIVLRGAQWNYCNNLIHLPFFTQGMDSLKDYFAEAIHERVFSPKLDYSHSNPIWSFFSVYFIISSQVVYCIVNCKCF